MSKRLRIIRISLKESKPRPKVGNWFEKFTTGEYIIPYKHMFDYDNRRIFTKGRRYKILDSGTPFGGAWEVIVTTDKGVGWVLYPSGELLDFYLVKNHGKKTKDH